MKTIEFYEVDGCTDFIPVKLIEEHKHMVDTLKVELTETGRTTFVPSIYKFRKPPKPQKPVVPKFVAEWIEKYKDEKRKYRLSHALRHVFNDAEVSFYIKQQEGDYTETIAEAWLYGYTVEQEKLYTVEIADAILTKITRGRNVQYKMLPSKDVSDVFDKDIYTTKLTEQEIKQKDERLWQWAKEVTDE